MADSKPPKSQASIVPMSQHGWRADRWLATQHPELSRNQARRWLERGALLRDGRLLKKGDILRAGDEIVMEPLRDAAPEAEPDAPLDVRFERDDLLVVNKPAGQPTGALEPGEQGTLAGALLGHYPELCKVGFGPREPGLVHRLDTYTSGLVLIARTANAFHALRQALVQNRIDKRYLAVVEGAFPATIEVDVPLSPDPQDRRKVRIAPRAEVHRASRTRFVRLETLDNRSLVEARARRAYRHQVRVHAAHLGHPLVGDRLYGARDLGGTILGPSRHALHAHYIAGEAMGVPAFEVTLGLADDLALLVNGWEP